MGIERHSDLVVLGRATHTRYMVLAENFPPQIAFHFDASQRDVLRFLRRQAMVIEQATTALKNTSPLGASANAAEKQRRNAPGAPFG